MDFRKHADVVSSLEWIRCFVNLITIMFTELQFKVYYKPTDVTENLAWSESCHVEIN